MSSASLIRTYNNAEFEALPEFDANYELLNGKLIEKFMQGYEHAQIVANLIEKVVLFDPARKLGKRFNDLTFDLGEGWMPLPDFAFIVASRLKPLNKKALNVVPDLVMEVWSPHDLDTQKRRDEAQAKIKQYQEVGVRIIWVVNPESRVVEVYHQNGLIKLLSEQDELDGEDVISGFQLKVADLFAE